ncbi:RNA polymerase sigma factor, partial [Steroidobacter sp.]|uniref:RNA polymerase sigma factor n=1 Tax=Steroidobacter sp. TaxID=1978227 RepID=UPI001A53EE7A
ILQAFDETQAILRRFVRRFAQNRHDVEDITQETIVRALQAEKDRKIEDPRAFLFGIAKNIVYKDLRRRSRLIVEFIDDAVADAGLPAVEPLDEQLDARQRMILFWQAVATLPPQCQKVFVMCRVLGQSHKEIAARLGISISTVEKHVAAGLKRCSDHLQGTKAPAADIEAARQQRRSMPK